MDVISLKTGEIQGFDHLKPDKTIEAEKALSDVSLRSSRPRDVVGDHAVQHGQRHGAAEQAGVVEAANVETRS